MFECHCVLLCTTLLRRRVTELSNLCGLAQVRAVKKSCHAALVFSHCLVLLVVCLVALFLLCHRAVWQQSFGPCVKHRPTPCCACRLLAALRGLVTSVSRKKSRNMQTREGKRRKESLGCSSAPTESADAKVHFYKYSSSGPGRSRKEPW